MFQRDDGRAALLRAESVWCRRIAGEWRAGFRFIGATAALPLLFDLSSWGTSQVGGQRVLHLHGEMGAELSLEGIRAAAASVDALDLRDLAEVDAGAADRLALLMGSLERTRPLQLRAVPATVARRLREVAPDAAIAIESLTIARVCGACSLELLDVCAPRSAVLASCPLCAAHLSDA